MISSHLPALQVVIPLLAAPLCIVVHRAKAAWAIALVVSWASLAISVRLLERVLQEGVVVYAMGGWAAPWGIEYRIDEINAFLLLIVSGGSALVLLFARVSVEREIEAERRYVFYTMWLLCLTGLLGIAITGDAFNVFVFLEISSLSSYVMISLGSDRRGLMAAFRYLIVGTIGATFILIGIGLLYMMTGTLNMADLAERLPAVADTRTVKVAFWFFAVGIGTKMALFPLHFWLPNAYAYAPSAASAFLAASATKVAVYVWLRFYFSVFGASFSFDAMSLSDILLPLGLVAALVGSAVAVFQQDVKRMLAYSSVAQIGYMAVGISFVSVNGLIGAIVHLFNHALMKAALFMVLGCVFYRLGSVALRDLDGLGRQMPWTMAAFVAGGLSLIGVPSSAGFISKWYLILAALESGSWPIAFLVLLSSLLAVVYVWRVVEAAYFRAPPDDPSRRVVEAPVSLLVPVWLLVAANFYFGLQTSLTVGVAERAARTLLGAGG